jgi:CDP-diacylglycerol--serine O-phosphatidyltransferase
MTLGNAVCGFASVAYASRIRLDGTLPDSDNNFYFLLSAMLILGAMIFDALDGYVARLSKSSSEFGGQLDSLCDAVSFGLAPAFLLLRVGQDWHTPLFRQAIAVIAALYLVCALLRLARFNLENSPDASSHKRFKGLPSPAAAGCLATLIILRGELSFEWAGLNEQLLRNIIMYWAPLGALVVALLMVSNFPYPHFTNELVRRRRRFDAIVQAVLIVCIIALMRELALFILFWVYALHAPIYSLVSRRLRNALPARHTTVE